MNIEIYYTPHNTIRSNIIFDVKGIDFIVNSNEYKLFELLSIWGGYDKREHGMFSWELPISLRDYLIEKFSFKQSFYESCIIDL